MKRKTTFIHRAAMTLLLAMLTTATAWAKAEPTNVAVTYLEMVNGKLVHRTRNATVLEGNETTLSWGYYVVNKDVHFDHCIQLSGNVYLILADDCTMTMGASENRLGHFGIFGSAGTISDNYGSDYELYIYGQDNQTGRLEIYSSTTKSNVSGIKVKELFVFGGNILLNGYNGINTSSAGQGTYIYNGNVSFTSLKNYGKGIDCYEFYMSGGSLTFNGLAEKAVYSKDFTMSGGSITVSDAGEIISKDSDAGTFSMTGGSLAVNGTDKGINAPTITLGLTKDGDQIKAGNYAGTVTVEDGRRLMDEDKATYAGTLTSEQKTAIKGKTLVPLKFDGTGTEQDPYVIHTANGWNTFCDMFGTNEAPNDFNNVYIKLGNDITVTTMAGTSDHPFKGHFDGDGHTLTFNYTIAGNYCAPFRYVNGASIEDLNVAGTIFAEQYSAGLIGHSEGTTSITNCRSSIAISSTIGGAGMNGGFVGWLHSGTLTISHCMFDGKLLTSNATNDCRGFVGANTGTLTIENSLYAPAIEQGEAWAGISHTFAPGSPTVTNSYYISDAVTNTQGNRAYRITAEPSANMTLNGTPGVQFGSTVYAANGETVSLTLSAPGNPPAGYENTGYNANSGSLKGSGTSYTLAMTDAQDVSITAFTLVTYNITYNLNEGSWRIEPPTIYTIESDDVMLPAPTKDGNSFMGWYDNEGLTGNPVSRIPAGSTGDKEFWAKWEAPRTKKSLTACTAEVTNPTYIGTDNFVGYSYENGTGIEVRDAENKVLSFGTDYNYGGMETLEPAGTYPVDDVACSHLGEHCRVTLIGVGDYEGTLTADVVIVPIAEANGTWGNLSWAFDGGAGTLTISGSGSMKELDKDNPSFPWYQYGSYITTIIFDNAITTIAANAFAGSSQINTYAGVTTIKRRTGTEGNYTYTEGLPTSLTSIGDDAFAYCTNATITIPSSVTTFGASPFNQVKCVVGSLSNTGDNSALISAISSAVSANVTLADRTLYKDGNWNTLCLPFDIANINAQEKGVYTCPLHGATLMELDVEGYYDAQNNRYTKDGDNYFYGQTQYTGDTSGFLRSGFDATGSTLYLYFKDATSIVAGKPYIIKWDKPNDYVTYNGENAATCSDLVSPEFTGVTLSASNPTTITSSDDYVTFTGIYAPTNIYTEEKTKLYLGADGSTLYYPWGDNMTEYTLNTFRCYFELNNGLTAGEKTEYKVKAFRLNFGGEGNASEIRSISTDDTDVTNTRSGWYTLNGVKLNSKPTAKGLYIYGNKKIMIK